MLTLATFFPAPRCPKPEVPPAMWRSAVRDFTKRYGNSFSQVEVQQFTNALCTYRKRQGDRYVGAGRKTLAVANQNPSAPEGSLKHPHEIQMEIQTAFPTFSNRILGIARHLLQQAVRSAAGAALAAIRRHQPW